MHYFIYVNGEGSTIDPLEDARNACETYRQLLDKLGDDYFETQAFLLEIIDGVPAFIREIFLPELDEPEVLKELA